MGSRRQGCTGTEALPAPGIGAEVVAGAHIPLDAHGATGQITDLNMDARPLRHPVRGGVEVRRTVLALHCVIGLAAIDPVAIDADAHAGRIASGAHSVL